MLRRNGSEGGSLRQQKLPIRSSRQSRQDVSLTLPGLLLRKKYLQLNLGAFYFRRTQEYLQSRQRVRELGLVCEGREWLGKYRTFQDTVEVIRGVVVERVERDYVFSANYDPQFFPAFDRYVQQHRKLKQRNLYNRYYFSSCPPKISTLTNPTATSLRPPDSNSTIELQALTRNLEAMLNPKHKKQVDKKKVERDRSKKQLRREEDVPEESYGLKNFKKGTKGRGKGSKDKDLFSIKHCVTPQPHSLSKERDYLFQSPSQPRLSERRPGSKHQLSAEKVNRRSRAR